MQIGIAVPAEVLAKLTTDEETGWLDAASLKYVTESIRLIADETRNGYVVMSTGQKGVVRGGYPINENGALGIEISVEALIAAADGDEDDIAAINAMQNSDQFTIEVDWGESPEQLTGNLVQATTAEYEAFKSRMETEIANILTPITEE